MFYFKIILDTDEIITIHAEDISDALFELEVSLSHVIAVIRQ